MSNKFSYPKSGELICGGCDCPVGNHSEAGCETLKDSLFMSCGCKYSADELLADIRHLNWAAYVENSKAAIRFDKGFRVFNLQELKALANLTSALAQAAEWSVPK